MRKLRIFLTPVAYALALAVACDIVSTPPMALAEKPTRNKGGGKGEFQSLEVTLGGGLAITEDGLGSYLDGVDKVQAVAGKSGGFFFKTTEGGKKIFRTAKFDFTGFGVAETGAFITTLPDDGIPDGDNDNVLDFVRVDARFRSEVLGDGTRTGEQLNLFAMTPAVGEVASVDFLVSFIFVNADEVEEIWWLTYGIPPGGNVESSLPVLVEAGFDKDGDGKPNYWTITGSSTRLSQRKVGNKEDPKIYGVGSMDFEMTVETL